MNCRVIFKRELTALGNPLDTGGGGREKRPQVTEEVRVTQTEMGAEKTRCVR